MAQNGVGMAIPDLIKYNHFKRVSPSAELFSGHSHNQYEILYVLSGDATHVIEDKKYKIRPGDLIITRPSKYHFIQMDSSVDYERHNILFDHKRLGIDMSPLPDGIDVVTIGTGGIIGDIFAKLDHYCESFDERSFANLARLLIQEIVYNLSLIKAESTDTSSVINPLLSEALTYIGEHLFEIRSISEVAQAVFVTESYLFRLFKKELLKSPKKYINEKRLLYAQTRLKKGMSPTETAIASGFEDYTTFYRNYVAFFGRSPSEEMQP